VFVAASTDIVVQQNLLTENREGVFLNGASGNVVRENAVWGNQLRGIMIRPSLSGVVSTDNLVTANVLIDNPSGILVFGQPGNELTENLISGSTVAAIDLTGPGASFNLVQGNLLAFGAAGIKFTPGWTNNWIIENLVLRNSCGLQGPADGNTVEKNVFWANAAKACP
jgi:parallel beta-helix repeat protein